MFGSSGGVLGPAMHPIMNVTPEESPMLSDFGRRQFTASCQLIDSGLRDAKKPCHLRNGENFSILSGARF